MDNDAWDTMKLTWQSVQESLLIVLPRLFGLAGLLLFGWIVALLLRTLARWALRAMRFDALLERLGAGPALAHLRHHSAESLVGSTVFWVVWLAFIVSGLHVLGVDAAQVIVSDLVRFIPRLLGASAVLVIGFLLANFLWRVVLLALANARVREARPLAATVKWLVIFMAVAMSLDQVGLGGSVALTAFALLFGGMVLAAAIALGLGGRHAARRFIERQLLARDEEKTQGGPHL